MTEQMTLTVKQTALQAIEEAKEQLQSRKRFQNGKDGTFTEEQVYELAAEISGLAPHMLRWAKDDR